MYYVSHEEAADMCAKEGLYYLYREDKLESFNLQELIRHMYKFAKEQAKIHWAFYFTSNFLASIAIIDSVLYPKERIKVFIGLGGNVYHYKLHFFQSHGYEQISESLAKRAGHRLCHTCLRNKEKWMNE